MPDAIVPKRLKSSYDNHLPVSAQSVSSIGDAGFRRQVEWRRLIQKQDGASVDVRK